MHEIVPRYYEKFKCIGSECPETCCEGWRISMDEGAYKKYQALDNNKLKNTAKKYIKKYPSEVEDQVKGYFAYIELKDGTCPFLGKDRLCKVQKECGSDFLSKTCAEYPRKVSVYPKKNTRSLNLGCPESARLILCDSNSMELIEDNLYKINNYIKLYDKEQKDTYKLLGEKIFNISFSLIKDKRYSLIQSLCVIQKIMEEQKNLEFFPERLDKVYNFLIDTFKDYNLVNIDTSSLKIEFLREFYQFVHKQNDDANDSSNRMSKSFVSYVDYAYKTLIKDFRKPKEQYENFKNLKEKYYDRIIEKSPFFLRNYFLNEFFANSVMFTQKKAFIEKRLEVALLGAVIPQILIMGQIGTKKLDLSLADATRAFYLTHKNIGHLTEYRGNFEYKFKDGLNSILEKIDKNSLFNSLLFLLD
ncbi:MAG: flagellin lysine-N-methylase [Pseudomonadota bacterium]|nr:flagellin lysine-N-methylase [Pseudomonadota bacterium]